MGTFFSTIFLPPLEGDIDLGTNVSLKWIQFRIRHYHLFIKMLLGWPVVRLFYLAKVKSLSGNSRELFPVDELVDQVIYLLFELHFESFEFAI
jgi:hypothetical protein